MSGALMWASRTGMSVNGVSSDVGSEKEQRKEKGGTWRGAPDSETAWSLSGLDPLTATDTLQLGYQGKDVRWTRGGVGKMHSGCSVKMQNRTGNVKVESAKVKCNSAFSGKSAIPQKIS